MAEKKLPAKGTAKAPTKQVFDINKFKKDFNVSHTVKDKELTWIPLSEAFTEAVKLPGIPRGYATLFRGFSNTGKSTAIYEAIAGAQKIGDFPVIIETEGNWNWEHARNIGVQFEEVVDKETGEITDYIGDFILVRGEELLNRYECYDYSASKLASKPLRSEPVIEDVAKFIYELIQAQSDGDFPRNLAFFWDSIGTLNCYKSVLSNSSNNQWNAGAMEAAFKSLLNFKIPSSKSTKSEYTNTFAAVQKVWLDNENKTIKHKGGEAAYYASRLIFHYGGILTHSTTKLKATSGGNDFQFGIETRISCEKNQITGIEEKGRICSTPHGYVAPDKLNDYKKKHGDFIRRNLRISFNESFDFVSEAITESLEEG